MRRPTAVGVLLLALHVLQGCSLRNPTWADSINPCCGQDLVLRGIDPPEDRCADIVVDQETARRLMADLAGGSGLTQWHARFIPGGPACIWSQWPGLTDKEFRDVRPPEDLEGGGREAAQGDSGVTPAPEATERGEAD
jgi:hypothetical protein